MTAVMFQNMPPLSPEEYAALETSIRENGIQVPILVDEDDVVVDGHHRRKIAQELGIECPTNIVRGKSDADKRTLALSLNLDRRHLNREQRRALIAESIRADPTLSNREHARRTGADDKTVGRVRTGLEESAEIPHFSERIDPRTGNPSQAASRPAPSFNPSPADIAEQEAEESTSWAHGDDLAVSDTSPGEPSKPKRSPLPQQFLNASIELRKCVERVERLVADDRFPRNKNEIASLYKSDLTRAADSLNESIAAFH